MSSAPAEARAERRGPLADLALAVGFLTIVPVRTRAPGARGLGRAAAWFPLVGAGVGALAGGVRALAEPALGPLAASALAALALVLATGALHQDGLADTADGLGARGGGPERRLAAMRDSAIGAFGVLALVFWGLLVVSALAPLGDARGFDALLAAGAASRWAALLHARGAPPARPDGLGASFHPGAIPLAVSTALAAAAALLACDPLPGLAALAAAALAALAVTALARRLLGGRTGDTLGATVALAEVAALLTLVGVWGG